MIKNREDIKDFILKIEKEFSVDKWVIDNIHIWPYLRIKLYFYLMNINAKNTIKIAKSIQEYSRLRLFFYRLKQINFNLLKIYTKYYLWFKELSKKENVFLGADSHRVDYKDKQFNRYFDVIIEKSNLKDKSIFFEYGTSSIQNQYNKEILYKYNHSLIIFDILSSFRLKRKHKITNSKEYNRFIQYLADVSLLTDFSESFSQENIEKWFAISFIKQVRFFTKILKKIKPKKIHILCYYSQEIMAFTTAANKLGIQTIEMQHGPQTPTHLAYGNWSNIPKEGYDMLPRTFWCWDNESKNTINNWTKHTSIYQTIVIGNPWLDYWKNRKDVYPFKNYILYSLQPSPVTLNELFPDRLIDFIKYQDYKWFVRLHPRQISQKEKIISFLKEKNIFHLININNATNDPLPQLISNSLINFTNFSGVTIEASLLKKKTVLINTLGKTIFKNYIDEKSAVYINPNIDSFAEKLLTVLRNNND